MNKRLLPAIVALGVVVLAACGGDSDLDADAGTPGGDGGGGDNTVVLRDIAFKPETISVNVGDTVSWRFQDKGIPHNVVADDGSFKSETTDSGTFRHRFQSAGSFSYTCTVHPGMDGTVVVS